MSGFHLDPDALRAVTDGLADAATTFDDAGQGVPTSADGGLAAGLVADILRTVGLRVILGQILYLRAGKGRAWRSIPP